MGCKHQWSEVRRSHSLPSENLTKIKSVSEGMLQQALFGATHIELRCDKCGDVIVKTFPGQLEERRDEAGVVVG